MLLPRIVPTANVALLFHDIDLIFNIDLVTHTRAETS